jgi:anti-sigma factor RsiW
MNCEEAERFLDAYLDGELELNERLELEEHLSLCTSCWCLAQERRDTRSFFRSSAPTFKAPPGLRSRVLATVRRNEARPAFDFLRHRWVLAVAVFAVFVLGSSLVLNRFYPDVGKEISRQAVLLYSRSLSADHLVEVASTNPQVVKSWLAAKLKFSPPVAAFPTSSHVLWGGRIDVIRDRSVATIVYKNEKDVVTLFCWPPDKEQLSQGDDTIEGCHVCTWSNAECNYILVSKLSASEMDGVMDSLRDQIQSGAYF